MTLFLNEPHQEIVTFVPKQKIDWTKEKIELLKSLIANGLSTSQIGEKLGTSKNSIIGKIDRLGFYSLRPPKPQSSMRTAVTRAPVTAKKLLTKRPWFASFPTIKKAMPEEKILPPDGKFACTFEELTESKCKYPLGDPQTPEFRFCGMPRLSGKPYCGHCSRLAYMPMTSMNLFGVPKS